MLWRFGAAANLLIIAVLVILGTAVLPPMIAQAQITPSAVSAFSPTNANETGSSNDTAFYSNTTGETPVTKR